MLQSSGQISMSQINQEIGRASNGQISLNVYSAGGTAVVQVGSGTVNINQCSASRPNTSAPTSMNEWYSYNHSASCGGGDPYPCNVDSGITTSGTGYSTLVYDNYGYLWATETAARAAFASSSYNFNMYAGFGAGGLPLTSVNTNIGNILKNTSATDGRNKCGALLWWDNTSWWVLVTDKVGQIIEKVLI